MMEWSVDRDIQEAVDYLNTTYDLSSDSKKYLSQINKIENTDSFIYSYWAYGVIVYNKKGRYVFFIDVFEDCFKYNEKYAVYNFEGFISGLHNLRDEINKQNV